MSQPGYHEPSRWKHLLKASRVTLKELDERGILPRAWRSSLTEKFDHPLAISERLIRLMDKGNPQCPIIQQYVPQTIEHEEGGFSDPIGDDVHTVLPGLIHRYKNRILVLTNTVCPVYCRYCFRKNSLYEGASSLSKERIDAIAHYIETNTHVDEVILSGGDPLVLTDETLERFFNRVESIPHLRTIRFHTKTIIAIPERVTERLLGLFKNSKKNIVLVHHTNHSAELGEDVASATKALSMNGVLQLNQAVLLKGVNDRADLISELSKNLVDIGVLPYYLSITDDVLGAQHFKVGIETAQKIYSEACRSLSGYERPKLILDLPEAVGKVNAEASAIQIDEDGRVSYLENGRWQLSLRDSQIAATLVEEI